MLRRFLTIEEVAEKLERHQDRIAEALAYGEIAGVWIGRERLIPLSAVPPYQRPSEEEG